ncbi:BLUF domain-containing protein [Sphingomonas sp. CFBP 13728]|uniref:BLUF domain-containing protein n=1 Tax=Sphingomonas sp. CFBP 13728 TaxID=2775294 RepID=UPI001780A2B5|nr:BLUF domain-containing protein [Sphingomonas sp. CFBP 13728]MBD8620443.1 BLUF domain-containing protein [Sphingomonas sp. CFBP 13728]
MRRIIYTSRPLTEANLAELDAIVAESIARNTKVGITGMLWSDGANFAQVIEGDHDEVGATMDRIRSDPRHTDIEVVLDRAVVSRQFGNWAMRRADDGEASTPSTTFLLGFALGERTASAKRLYEIIIATER